MRATHETEAFCCSIAGRGHIVPVSRLTLLLRSYQKLRCAGTCAIVMQAYTDRQAQQVNRGFALSQDCEGCEYPHAQVAVVGRNRVRIMDMYIILEGWLLFRENHIPPVNRQPQDSCRSERVAVTRASICAAVSRCRRRDWMAEDRL